MIGAQLRRLGKHSAIYGLGGLVSRILAVLLLPLYTSYLTPADFGRVETLVALNAILVTLLRGGISTAFFRFYFDSTEPEQRLKVLRTSFWFTMATSTLGLVLGWIFASAISDFLKIDDDTLVRAAFIGLWAQMNYEQLTSLFRVEERSVAFVLATLSNLLVTVGARSTRVRSASWWATSPARCSSTSRSSGTAASSSASSSIASSFDA